MASGGSTPSTWDCLLHPIDCAEASAAAAHGAVAGASSGAGTIIGDVVDRSTRPLHEVEQTAMWVSIGVVVVAVVFLAVFVYVVIKVG